MIPLLGGVIGTLAKRVLTGGTARKIGGKIIGAVAGKSGAAKTAAAAAASTAAGAAVFTAGTKVAERAFGGEERKRGRRTNVGNIKALRRAMSRVQGFAKLAKSTIQFTKTTRMKKRKGSR